MGFAEGLAAGSSAGSEIGRTAVSTFSQLQGAIQQGKIDQDTNERLAVAKQERDFGQGLQQTMAAAAQDQAPTQAAAAPAPTFNQLTDANAMAGSQGDGSIAPPDVGSMGTAGGLPNSVTPQATPDARPEWQRRVDAYTAGTDYAIKHGHPEVAADMVHQVASTRVMAAQQQAQTGYRQWIASGQTDPSGLIQAFNTVDDGIKATGITPSPDGKSVTLHMENSKGQPLTSQTISNDQLPTMVQQYFDPNAAYQRQVGVLAERASAQYASQLKINEKSAESSGDTAKELAVEEAKRSGRAPEHFTVNQGDGRPDKAFIISPNSATVGGGSTVAPLDGSGTPDIPRLSKQDVEMHQAINKQAGEGVYNGMIPATPEVKAATDARILGAQTLYDANRNDSTIGPQNESKWLEASDAIAANKAGPISTRVDPKTGQSVKSVTYNGVTYALNDPTIPLNQAPGAQPAPKPVAPVANPAAAARNSAEFAARQPKPTPNLDGNTPISILQGELAQASTRLQNATDPEDQHRFQQDVLGLRKEIAQAGGRGSMPAPIITAPATVPVAAPVVATGPASARAPQPFQIPQATQTAQAPAASAPVLQPIPPAATSAPHETLAVRQAIARAAQPKTVDEDTRRLAEVNAQLFQQGRAVVDGKLAQQSLGLLAEREAIKGRLSAAEVANNAYARTARDAAERAQTQYARSGGGSVRLR